MPYANDNSESPLHLPEQSSAQAAPHGALAPVANPSAYGPAVAMSPLPPALAAAPDMKCLLKSLKRHWLLATTLGLLAASAASAAVWYFTPVRYTADVVLRLNLTKLIKDGFDDKEGASPFTPQGLASLVTSRFVVRAALDQQNGAIAQLPSVREQFDPVEWLRNKLVVGYISPELLSISISGTNPPELVALVDAVARVYESELAIQEGNVRKERVQKLDAIIDRLQKFVKSKREAYENLVKAIGSTDPNQRQHQADFDKMLLQSMLTQLVTERSKLERLELDLIRAKKRDGRIYIPKVEISKRLKENRGYQALIADIERHEQELITARDVYRVKNHPRLLEREEALIKEKEELKALEKKLFPQIKKDLEEYYKDLKVDTEEATNDEVAAVRDLIDDMQKQMNKLEDAIKKQGPDSLLLQELAATFKPEEEVVDRLRAQRAPIFAQLHESMSSVKIHDKAAFRIDQNVKKLIMMSGGAGGAALGLVLLIIAYWEFRVRRINNVEDVVYGLGWRLVGQLPALPERARRGLLRKNGDPRYWQNLMTESVDATRTTILHAARVEGLRTVLVTSAVSGEGKTSLSCHLACSLARAGRKTLLLDCDLRNPAAHRLFELPGEPGLCEVLRGEVQLAEVIRATPANNLWLIPAGQFDEEALQKLTLSQNGFSPILEQLKTQFDFIVLDSSPVLPVVDTLVIGQNVDVVVFSLLRDVSRIPNVYAAYQRLATLGIRILGAVVNGVDAGRYGYAPQYAKQTN